MSVVGDAKGSSRLLEFIAAHVRRHIAGTLPHRATLRLRRLIHGESAAQRSARRMIARGSVLMAGLSRGNVTGAARESVRAMHAQGRPALAWVVSRFTAEDVLAQHASLVADALSRAGVEYFCQPVERGARRVLVVGDDLRGPALDALRDALGGTATYMAPVDPESHLGYARLVRRGAAGSSPGLRVFRYLAAPGGQLLSGAELGCDLQFWHRSSAESAIKANGEPIVRGSLVSTHDALLAPTVLMPEESLPVTRIVDGRPRPVARGLATPHLFSVRHEIDAVYTWVDGSDAAWLRRKAAALQSAGEAALHPLAANPSRFDSHDELKYSLRSLDMFAPWIRHIYVVTDRQTPTWLDTYHPRITIVDHRDLFEDRGRLPTFNSHAIETQLHHVPGLSEHFLYVNDDVFFGRPVSPSLFFHANGLSRFFVSPVRVDPGPVQPADLPVTSAAKNNRDLIRRSFGRTVTHKFRHTPHALRRSVLFELEAAYREDMERTACAQFRSPTDLSVPASLAHYYAFQTGRAVPGDIEYGYADLSRDDTPERLSSLLRRRHWDVFCLNDHAASTGERSRQHELARWFLESYFPVASQFEWFSSVSHDPGTGK